MKYSVPTFALLLLAAVNVQAQAPTTMNYQGRLIDGTNLLTGSHSVQFHIYDDPASNTILYAEFDTVTVDDGFYATELGDNPESVGSIDAGPPKQPTFDSLQDLFAAGGPLYLELKVDGTTLSPREQIHSTAFAMVAGEALGVASGSITSSDIANGTITTADIANGTITRLDVADYMRSTLDSADGSVQGAVTLDNDGNVGVGTSDPAAGLQVSGGVDIINPVLRSVMQDSDGTYTNLNACYRTVVSGNHAFIGSYYDDAITVVNVSNPDSPTLVTTLKDGVGGFNYLGGIYWLAVEGDYLYAGSYDENAISIINISTPSSPTLATTLVDGIAGYNYLGRPTELMVHNNLLFIPSYADDAVTIVDVSTPSTPVLRSVLIDGTGSFTNLGSAWAVACEGDYAYIAAAYDNAMTIVDVSNPASPQFMADIKDGEGGFDYIYNPCCVAVSGGYVYISGESTLTVVDCRVPDAPVLTAAIPNLTDGFSQLSSVADLSVSGDRLYIAAYYGVTVADISDPTAPRPIVELRDGQNGFDALSSAESAFAVGDRLYVNSYGEDAVTIVDISATNTAGTAGLYVMDRVGINTPIPREALDVRGNIIASGDITAGDDLIAKDDVFLEVYAGGDYGRNVRMDSSGALYASSTKYEYVSVPPCAFQPVNDGSGVTAYTGYYARMASGTYAMFAPVQLPHQADIYSIFFYYYDIDASSSLYMALRSQGFNTTAYTTIASSISSSSSGYDYEYEYPSSNDVVENNSYTYHLYIYPNSGSWSSSLRFMGARIYYSIAD